VIVPLIHTGHSLGRDLYGRVAMPKHNSQDQVPEIYRLAAASGGLFVNPALTEPFGLTLLEAAASGLQLVATENGGPADIIGSCDNGILVDPLDKSDIAAALPQLLTDTEGYRKMRDDGILKVREIDSWSRHAERYMARATPLRKHHEPIPVEPKRQKRYRDRALFTDIDQSLLGDAEGVRQLVETMQGNRKRLDSTMKVHRVGHSPVPYF